MDREFSGDIMNETVFDNMKKNNGIVKCEICKKQIKSRDEAHFDHIIPYSKGGKSTKDNCQILCCDCNLSKSNKALDDFVLDKKAKDFIMGENDRDEYNNEAEGLTKEQFDSEVASFIDEHGTIKKADFTKANSTLPTIWYVRKYYGTIEELKKRFGITKTEWSRDNCYEALNNWIDEKGDIYQKDLRADNNLPSMPTILKFFPEINSFSELKNMLIGRQTRHGKWTREEAIEVGRRHLEDHGGKITQNVLNSNNGLPDSTVILRLFGSLGEYQKIIGAEVTSRNRNISLDDISKAVDDFFKDKERIIQRNRYTFFNEFPYSESTIIRFYGSFNGFCNSNHIVYSNNKRTTKFTREDVDNVIKNYIKNGGTIPKAYELTSLGLPSQSSICNYYSNWREPFIMYSKLFGGNS